MNRFALALLLLAVALTQLPLAFLFLHETNPWREILLFTITALGTCLLAYIPALTTPGLAAWYDGTAAQLADVRQHQVLDFRVFAYRSIYAFGPLATAAALCFTVTKWNLNGSEISRSIIV